MCVKNSRANSEQAARQRYSKTFNRKYALTCLHCLDRLLQSFRSGRITATKNGWTVDDLCVWSKSFRQWDGNLRCFAVGVVSLSTDSDNLKNVAKNNLLFRSCLLMPFFFWFFFVVVAAIKECEKGKRHVINSPLCIECVSSLFLYRWQKMWWKVRPVSFYA